MTYYAFLGCIFINVVLCTDIQPSLDALQLQNNSTELSFEARLRLLEETLSAINGMTEGDSVEQRLLQLERTLLAANARVNQLESKLRRATTVRFARDLVSDHTQGRIANIVACKSELNLNFIVLIVAKPQFHGNFILQKN